MNYIGAVVLSFEEAGELNKIVPWKVDSIEKVWEDLQKDGIPLGGMIYLSTCNRVEFIYTLTDPTAHTDFILSLVQKLPPLADGIRPRALQGRQALLHLLRLTSGLESMVLGETEIRAQLKDAYEAARKKKMADQRLNILFRNLLQEARIIRSSISMSNLPLSVATLATKYLQQHEQDLNPEASYVIIGSGPMSRQAAEYLSKSGKNLILVNRTPEKVQAHADRIGASVFSFDHFMNKTKSFGPIAAIVTATSHPDAFITEKFASEIIDKNNSGNSQKNLVLVDMAMPPDVSPDTEKRKEISLVSMESLKNDLEKNKKKRKQAAEEAEEFIEESLFRIEVNLVSGMSGPLISKIQKKVKNKARDHLNLLLEDRLSHLSKKDRRLIYTWAIQANRDMNRIHRDGLELMIRNLYTYDQDDRAQKGSV
ncbi:MAG: hypothetical protein OEZ34_06360 [Spirochaetia bacterium]|nr:hypothetical protein [Spirochaetia bacterium]